MYLPIQLGPCSCDRAVGSDSICGGSSDDIRREYEDKHDDGGNRGGVNGGECGGLCSTLGKVVDKVDDGGCGTGDDCNDRVVMAVAVVVMR